MQNALHSLTPQLTTASLHASSAEQASVQAPVVPHTIRRSVHASAAWHATEHWWLSGQVTTAPTQSDHCGAIAEPAECGGGGSGSGGFDGGDTPQPYIFGC